MKNGRAPIGPDGKPINAPHLLQTQRGPIVEVTETFHKMHSRILHINSGTKIPSGIHRPTFDKWKKEYWKMGAKDFE